MLDTPFLTRGLTESESEHTTLRGTMKLSNRFRDIPMDSNSREKQEKEIPDLKYKVNPHYQMSASSRRYSEACNSSSDSTEKNSVPTRIMKMSIKQHNEFEDSLADKENQNMNKIQEMSFSKQKKPKQKSSGSERRKISEYYEGKDCKSIRKALDVKAIINNMDTPKDSEQTTLM